MPNRLYDRNAIVKFCPDCKKDVDVKEFYKNRNGLEKYCKLHKMMRQSFTNALKFKKQNESLLK